MTDLARLDAANRRALERAAQYRLDRDAGRIPARQFQTLKHEFPYFGFVPCRAAGQDFVMFSANDDVVAWEYFWTLDYEVETVAAWAEICARPGTVLDIGAYTGCMAVLATGAHRDTHVIAFEPMLRTVERCKINLAANGVRDRVTVLPVAASEAEGRAEINMPRDKEFLGTGNSIFAKPNVARVDTETIRTRRVDDCLAELAPAAPVTAIKLDVEGHEVEALRGMDRTLAAHRPPVIVEVWAHEKDALFQLLRGHGYRGRHLEGMNWLFEPG